MIRTCARIPGYQRILFLTFLVLLSFVPTLAYGGEESGLQVRMVSSPAVDQIRPDLDVTQFSIEVTDAQGQPVRDVEMAFSLDSPAKKFFPSTDFPVVEGTTLMKSNVWAPEGKLDFKYVFPIRGEYTLTVKAFPKGNPKLAVEKVLRFSIHENPPEVRNGMLFMLGLLLFGGIVGYLLTSRKVAAEVV